MLLVSVTRLRMHETPIGRFTSFLKLEHEAHECVRKRREILGRSVPIGRRNLNRRGRSIEAIHPNETDRTVRRHATQT